MKIFTEKNKSRLDFKKYFFLSFLFFILGIYLGHKNILSYIKANIVLLNECNLLDALTESNDLDTLHLNISFKNLQKIENKRQEAIGEGRLISNNSDYVKAKITFDDNDIDCKVRLKGDLPDHWSNKRISLRVKLSESNIYGLVNFSLQRHGTRQDTGNWLYISALREANIMSVDYEFVNFKINGQDFGIYGLEGHFGKDIFDKCRRRENVIIGFDEQMVWEDHDFLNEEQLAVKLLHNSRIIVRDNKSVQNSKFLKEQSIIATGLLKGFIGGNLNPEEVFDAEVLGKFLALTRVWNAQHALHLHNINFYLNPVTCKLEPIGCDGMPDYGEKPFSCYFSNKEPHLLWVRKALESKLIQSSYLKYLEQYSTENYFFKVKEKFYNKENHLRNLIVRNLLLLDQNLIWSSFYTINTHNQWKIIENRIKIIRSEFKSKKAINASIIRKDKKSFLNVINYTEKPISLLSFKINSKLFKIDEVLEGLGNNELIVEPTNFDEIYTNKTCYLLNKLISNFDSLNFLKLEFQYLGTTFKNTIDVNLENFEFTDQFYIHSKFCKNILETAFTQLDGQKILINPGIHLIKEPLFIESGYSVHIEAGTEFRFTSNSFIISKSPILANGTSLNKIKFLAHEKYWGGLIVIDADKESKFINVLFQHISGIGTFSNEHGISCGGWNITGGVCFYKSAVLLDNCEFNHCISEDSLNIISSNFSMINCNFYDSLSDGFDGDFVQGFVSNCNFKQILGDGVDFSGSLVSVDNCNFINIKDKAVSVGESSQVKVINCFIENVSFGIVSKDNSTTDVLDFTSVKNASHAAFSAFQKKETFGPAKIIIKDFVTLNCNKQFLIQDGSVGFINDKLIKSTHFLASDYYNKI